MKPRLLTLTAGVPPEIGERVVQRFAAVSPVISWLPLPRTTGYSTAYSTELYVRFAKKLRERESRDRHALLRNVLLVLLYVDKRDESESHLFSQFGSEALVIPFGTSKIWDSPLSTGNQKDRATNRLVRDGESALRHARNMLNVIAQEVAEHDSRTCLLLPPKNFGRDAVTIKDVVQEASLKRGSVDEFKKRVRTVSRSIKTKRERGKNYFAGEGGILFQSPSKARARHGNAPAWDAPDHDPTCVIRGRIRFGSSFDPSFHYDCSLQGQHKRTFLSCHGTATLPGRRNHVNISPNDNIR